MLLRCISWETYSAETRGEKNQKQTLGKVITNLIIITIFWLEATKSFCYRDGGLTPLFQWRCRSVSRGWVWRCGGPCWGWAGRQTGSPPAGRGSRTRRTPSYTHTGTWRRNICCLLLGCRAKWWNTEGEFPVFDCGCLSSRLYAVSPPQKSVSVYYHKSDCSFTRGLFFLPGEVKKTSLKSSLWATWRTSPVTFTSLPATGGTLRKSRILTKGLMKFRWSPPPFKCKERLTVHSCLHSFLCKCNANLQKMMASYLFHHLISHDPPFFFFFTDSYQWQFLTVSLHAV